MKIVVVCTGCRKRFEVSEKFAGKSGPCPSCKKIIKIPAKSEQVVIHAPQEFDKGGRDKSGQLVLKPIARTETRLNPVTAAVISAAGVLVLLTAWIGGRHELFQNYWITATALLLLSPVLAVAAYTFLYDDEREPFRGRELWIRAAICGLAYLILWGIFGYVADRAITEDLWTWFYVTPPFIAFGAAAAAFSLDLDFGNAAFHYAFYLLITIFLRWIAGLGWVWEIARG